MTEFEFRNGVPYVTGPPLTAAEAFDEKAPLSTNVLLAAGWAWEDARLGDVARREYFANKRKQSDRGDE